MTLRIHSTSTGEKEAFIPLQPGQVSMYVCGVTTYNYCHIGHGRAAVVFDVVSRDLRRRGFKVNYVRNYTDVDDKIIRQAELEGCDWHAISNKYVAATQEDMLALGCAAPDHEPRVTQHIPQIIDIIASLVTKGHAYPAVNGDVYFSVESFPRYGSFSGQNIDQLQAGARIDVNEDKRSPLDFALWKGARAGDPAWESPWGPGRPGWHIECSAMCKNLLGESFDIHGGGSDLIFPHHENEIAQSEGASGKVLARYWMHNGMITINKEKMSKSLNNFFTIRDALDRFHRETLRLFLLSTQYRNPVDFSDSSLEEAEAGLERLYHGISVAEQHIARDRSPQVQGLRNLLAVASPAAILASKPWLRQEAPWDVPLNRWTDRERQLHEVTVQAAQSLDDAMNDDFNTAKAIGHLFELSRAIGRFLHRQPKGGNFASMALAAAVVVLKGFAQEVLGILMLPSGEFTVDLNRRRLISRGISEADVEAQVEARRLARASKDWAGSDRIRDALMELGIQVEDFPEGTQWRVLSRVTLTEE